MDDATPKPTETPPPRFTGTADGAEPCAQRPRPDLPLAPPPSRVLEAFDHILPPRITPREREILGLIAEGLTDPEIARRLWMSIHTVHTHQAHLREKFQVRTRTALVREAERFGYILPDPKKSPILAIGAGERPGYTQDQEVEPGRSPEETGGVASADGQGETEMLSHTSVLWCLAALLAVGAGKREAGKAPPDMGTRRVWAGPGVDLCGAPAPDGRSLTFVDWDTGDLAIRDFTTGKSRRLTHKGSWSESNEFGDRSIVSPDGKQIAYVWFNKEGFTDLRVIGRDGSKPRVLYRDEKLSWINFYDWSPDGKQLLVLFETRSFETPTQGTRRGPIRSR